MNEMIPQLHGHACPIGVSLGKQMVGEIRKVDGGYQYFPKGQRTGGEVFQTVSQVVKSLGPEEDL